MNILYKYYSSRFDLDSYLLSPTIRLAQTTILNDPFEGKMSRSIIKLLAKRILVEKNIGSTGSLRQDEIHMRRTMETFMRSIGIVSLSETQRNLLMWAHYASEHKGCCIGYKDDLFETLHDKPQDHADCYNFKPTKVNYDSVVFDEEVKLILDSKEKFTSEDIIFLIKKAVTTKSNDWIYEKEHRIVAPIEWSDHINIRGINSIPDYVKEPLEEIKNNDNYNLKISEQMATIYLTYKGIRNVDEEPIGSSFENKISDYKDAMFLKNIEKDKIQSIYLGAKYPQTKEKSLKNLISDKKNGLSHINLYRYSLSNERFELNASKI